MTTEQLRECPACGSSASIQCSDWVRCSNEDCILCGPEGDPDGAKWNALPRRGDADSKLRELREWVGIESYHLPAFEVRRKIDELLAAPPRAQSETVEVPEHVRKWAEWIRHTHRYRAGRMAAYRDRVLAALKEGES